MGLRARVVFSRIPAQPETMNTTRTIARPLWWKNARQLLAAGLISFSLGGSSGLAQEVEAEASGDLPDRLSAEEALREAEHAWFGERPNQPLVSLSTTPESADASQHEWLSGIELPDLPVRFHPQVLDYLHYFRDDRRGRHLMRTWLQRSARYGPMIQRELQNAGVPEDLRCVAMAESGFNPTVRSNRGAAGLWQFVTRTGNEYGLERDRWVDQRLDPVASTQAAARMLGDLHQRFGGWELALAAYNMGPGALLRSIRKYNSNDYWMLAEIEAGLPYETTVYVSKIVACGVVMRNPERFGFGEVTRDTPLETEGFEIEGGVRLSRLARSAGVPEEELIALNPHLLRQRTPPGRRTTIQIPAGRAESFARAWTRARQDNPATQAYLLRFGENLRSVARRYRTSVAELRELNAVRSGESISAGSVILVPAVDPLPLEREGERPVVAIPATEVPEGMRRVFYEVQRGDSLAPLAAQFGARPADLANWNQLDLHARLHSGMYLQAIVPESRDLRSVVTLNEDQVRLVTVGTEEFFNQRETEQGRIRFRYRISEGDTLGHIARRFGLSIGSLARINRFSRRTTLQIGQEIIVYAEASRVPERLRRGATPAPEGDEPASEPTENPATTPSGDTARSEDTPPVADAPTSNDTPDAEREDEQRDESESSAPEVDVVSEDDSQDAAGAGENETNPPRPSAESDDSLPSDSLPSDSLPSD